MKTINNTTADKIKRYSLLTGFGLVLIFAIVMYNNYKANEIEKSYPPVSEVSYYTSYEIDGQIILIPTRQ